MNVRHRKALLPGETRPVVLCKNARLGDTATARGSKACPVTCQECLKLCPVCGHDKHEGSNFCETGIANGFGPALPCNCNGKEIVK